MKTQAAIVIIGALVLVTTPACAAENWIIYREAGAAWGYDAESLKRDPQTNRITAISATYVREAAEYEPGTMFHYSMSEVVYDCSERTWRYNDVVFLDADAKAVKTLSAGANTTWKKVDDRAATDGITRRLFGIGCDGKPPKADGVSAGDMSAALAMMKGTN